MAINQYSCPSPHTDPTKLRGWLMDAVTEARAFVEDDPGFADIDRDTQIISDAIEEKLPSSMSRVRVNRAKAQVLDVAATLTDVRPLWTFETQNKEYDQQGKVLNKASKYWWYKTRAALKLYSVLQYSLVQRTGYLHPFWNPNYHAPGLGDIDLKVLGPDEVLPLWIGKDYDLQKAYGVVICEELSIPEARATYPFHAALFRPDSENASWFRRGLRKLAKPLGADSLFTGKRNSPGQCPTVTIYHLYVRDLTLNTSGKTVLMGDAGTNWSYDVPSTSEAMPSGVFKDNVELSRPAKDSDCLLYPNRRLVSFTETAILYDGPSRYIHGEAPVVKFTLDPWPWTYLGGSMAHDQASIDEHNNRLFRAISDHADLTLDPAVAVDERQMGEGEQQQQQQTNSLRVPGKHIPVDFSYGEIPFKPLPPGQLPTWLLEHIKDMEMRGDDIAGRMDIRALAQMRQMPGGDTVEKVMQAMGPRTKLKSNLILDAMTALGDQWKGLAMQWYDGKRRYQMLGDEGLTKEDYEYLDYGSLVPAALPGIDSRSALSRNRGRRASIFQHYFQFHVSPGNLHDITSITNQLMLFKLWQDQRFPISPWKLAESMNLNIGRPPETKTGSEVELAAAYMAMTTQFQAILQAKAQQIMQSADPQSQIAATIQGLLGGGQNGHGATGGPEGRPASYNDPPVMEERSDGQGGNRTVINTSR